MRILYLVPDMFGPGGIARYCRLVAKALCESPAVTRLDIVALNDPTGLLPDSRYLSGAAVSYLSCNRDRWLFARRALALGFATNYDLVLNGHVNFAPLLLGLLRTRSSARALVTFVYGLEAWKRLPWYRRYPLRLSDSVIAISHYTAARAISANGLNPGRVKVVHNCLDPLLAAHADDAVKGADPRISADQARSTLILSVGRLSRQEAYKGYDLVMRALPQVAREVPDVRYHIVGEGDLRVDLEHARSLGIQNRVSFLGRVSDEELVRCYQSCSIYAMPSRAEGFGFVFLEAMAHGCAILAGNEDASAEAVGEEAAVLVHPTDLDEISRGLVRLLTDGGLRTKLGCAGKKRTDRLFRFERFKSTLSGALGIA